MRKPTEADRYNVLHLATPYLVVKIKLAVTRWSRVCCRRKGAPWSPSYELRMNLFQHNSLMIKRGRKLIKERKPTRLSNLALAQLDNFPY